MVIDKKKFDLLRAEKGLLVKEILETAHCSHYIGTKISNSINLSPYTVGKIAKALGVSVADIIAEEGG